MGYMRHHAILVTTAIDALARAAHVKALSLFDATLVSGVQESIVNGYHSFAIFPDGSKEGWQDSDAGDRNRAAFLAWADTQRYEDQSTSLDWVEVQYGDDDHETCIVHDSDAYAREKG